MKLLHISDLHVTVPGETLESLWFGPAAALRRRRRDLKGNDNDFDFVVISGDLSQEASPEQYNALERLIRNSVLPLLKVRDVWRIIMVPGNHDVNWDVKFPEWNATTCTAGERVIGQEWELLARAPERSRLRVELGAGKAKFFDIGVAKEPGVARQYFERMRNVQEFFDRMYGPAPGENKRFNLLLDGDDWSLHVFESDRVAFFGLNSCSRNDKCWTGASFNRDALVQIEHQARELLERWGPEALLVAVWHHGLETDRGRPDRLALSDLAALHNAGIRVAFHGHVHEDVSRVVHMLDRAMVLVSTGSIGAHGPDRPDCVSNQFGVVDLNPACVSVQRYERDRCGVYVGGNSELFHLVESSAAPERSTWFVERQSRTWKVSQDGIARIDVTFENVRNPSGLVLAVAGLPYGNVLGESHATVDGARVDVHARAAEDGRMSFELAGGLPAECERIDWSLAMANVVAFSEADVNTFGLSATKRRPERFPNCPPGYDQISTKVVAPSAELKLALELEEGAGSIASSSVVVEQEHDSHGMTRWSVDRTASRRCKLEKLGERSVEVTCKYPEVGQRISILFQSDAPGLALPPEAASLSALLLDIALRSPPGPDAYDVVGGMTNGVRQAIRSLLYDGRTFAQPNGSAFLGRGTDWIGLLWDRQRTRLFPAFGEFIRHDWSVSFAAGETARGHAFRFAKVSGWHPHVPETRIFAPSPSLSRREQDRKFENSWNLSVPVRVGPAGAAVGVVSLHGTVEAQRQRSFERELELLAEHCADLRGSAAYSNRLAALVRAVNLGFWTSLANLGGVLGKPEAPYARKVAAEFGSCKLDEVNAEADLVAPALH